MDSAARSPTSRGDVTRDRLVEVAGALFGERGYEATSIEAVLQAAGVSRGSLYHHFSSKGTLFEAVVEAMETRVGEQVAAAGAAAQGAVGILKAGAREWIRLAGDPQVHRVLLIDAPSVLGWDEWRALEERHALGLVKAILESASDQRLIRREMVDVMAHVLLAAMNEVALFVARAEDPQTAMRQGFDAVDDLLGGLFGA
jgi:AcrR family transcriptional regulator